MNVHAIVGGGSAPSKVIFEGLRDVVKEGDTVAMPWYGKPTKTWEAIYDYVLDNEVPFLMHYEDGENPAKVFRNAENGAVQKVRSADISTVKAVDGKGKVLYLWDSDEDDDQIEGIADHIPDGTLILELTNGLAPISLDVDIPEPKEPEVKKDEDEPDEDDTRFTRDELETMTAVAVKRYGARLGCRAATKKGIIDELFPDGAEEPDEDEKDRADSVASHEERNVGSAPAVDSEVGKVLRVLAGDLLKLANLLAPAGGGE